MKILKTNLSVTKSQVKYVATVYTVTTGAKNKQRL